MDVKLLFAVFTFVVFQESPTQILARENGTILDLGKLLEIYNDIIEGYHFTPFGEQKNPARKFKTTLSSQSVSTEYGAVTFEFLEFPVPESLIRRALSLYNDEYVAKLKLPAEFEGTLKATTEGGKKGVRVFKIRFGTTCITTTVSPNGEHAATFVEFGVFELTEPMDMQPLYLNLLMDFARLFGEDISKRVDSSRNYFVYAPCSG